MKPWSAFTMSKNSAACQALVPYPQDTAHVTISPIQLSPMMKKSSTTIMNLWVVRRLILSLAAGAQTPKARDQEANRKKIMFKAISTETGRKK